MAEFTAAHALHDAQDCLGLITGGHHPGHCHAYRLAERIRTALATVPMLAHAQQGGPPSNATTPKKADAQKVVQIITSDKAKTQTYCDLDTLYDRIQTANQNNDSKPVESLGKQADFLASKLGPEYNKMMGGIDQVDTNSNEGKELVSILSGLDKLCSKIGS